MVAVIGDVLAFCPTNVATLPLPFKAKPIDGVLLIQLNPVPDPLKVVAGTDALLHAT
jgi:hypothetical protein